MIELQDKELQADLLHKIAKLEYSIDWVGETPVRHRLSELIVEMRRVVKNGVPETRGQG